MTGASLELLVRSLRPRQPGYAIMTGVVALLGAGFQMIAWTANDGFGTRLAVALATGIPAGLGLVFMLRAQLRRQHPLVGRLRAAAPGLRTVQLAYVIFRGQRLARLGFEFSDGRRYQAFVPEGEGEALLRDAQADASAPSAAPLPRAVVVETQQH